MNQDNKSIKNMIDSIKVNRLQAFDIKERNKNLPIIESPKSKRDLVNKMSKYNMSLYSIMNNPKNIIKKDMINSLRRNS